MKKRLTVAMFGQKRLTREGGVEIVVKELCTRMAQRWVSNYLLQPIRPPCQRCRI